MMFPTEGAPNIVPKDHEHEFFFDDCPICQAMKERDWGEWYWHYDDGGFPLIAEYDREGWNVHWAEDNTAREKRSTDEVNDIGIGPNLPIQGLPDCSKN